MRAAQSADHSPGGRGDINNAAVALRLHRRKGRLREQEWRGEIDLKGGVPFLRSQIRKPRGERERGIVNDNVDAAKALKCHSYDLLRRTGRGDVTRDGQGAFADRRGETFGPRAVTHIHCHRSAAFVEALRRGPPEPAPGAGDDDNASGKVLR